METEEINFLGLEEFDKISQRRRYLRLVLNLSLSALVPNRISETEFGWSRKKSFIALPGKWEHSGLLPSKLCIPTQVDLVGSFMAMLKGGVADKGQGVCRASGSLLMSFCGPWGYQIVTSLEWRMPHQVVNVFVGDFGSSEELKDIVMCILWGGTRTLPQGCTIVSNCFSLSPYPSLPWLATVWTYPLELREGHKG